MAEIEKIAVYDARIIQDPPKYGVQKGALSVSTSQFQATAANASQLQFQVLVPSLNVFTDRKIELNASPYVYAEAVPSQICEASGTQAPYTYNIQAPATASQCYTIQDQPIPATYPPPGTPYTTPGNAPTAQFNGGNTACVLPADSWPGLTGVTTTTSPNYSDPTLSWDVIPQPEFQGNAGVSLPQQLPLISPGVANPLTGTAGIEGVVELNCDLHINAYVQILPLQCQKLGITGTAAQNGVCNFWTPSGDDYICGFAVGMTVTAAGWGLNPSPNATNYVITSVTFDATTFEYGSWIVSCANVTSAPNQLITTNLGTLQVNTSNLDPTTGNLCGPVNLKVDFVDPAAPTVSLASTLVSGMYSFKQNPTYPQENDVFSPQLNCRLFQSVPLSIKPNSGFNRAPNLQVVVTYPPTSDFDEFYGLVMPSFVTYPNDNPNGLPIQVVYGNFSIKLAGPASFSSIAGGSTDNYYQSIGAPSDLSLGLFPIQSLARTITGTINDCTVSVTGDTFHEQLLVSQTRDSLMQRTCASKYDVYAQTVDDARANSGAIQSYENTKDSDIPNGASPIIFVDPTTGRPLQQFDAYQYKLASGTTVTVPVINYRPAFIPIGSNLIGQVIPSSTLFYDVATTPPSKASGWIITATDCTQPTPVMFTFQSVEPLCLSPLLWQDSKQMTEVGLYGTTNMTVNMTLAAPGASVGYDTATIDIATTASKAGRMYMDRYSNATGSYSYMTRQSGINALFGNMRLLPPVNNLGNQTGPWVQVPRLLCTFLTPPPEITLPLVSSVPYVEFPRYNSTAAAIVTQNGTFQVQSNTITLSSIPDLLVVFVKPAFKGQTQGDTYFPITNIAVTFDNYSNLCNNYSQEDLYACSVAGGLDMDWHQFRGYARGRFPTLAPASSGRSGVGLFDTFQATSPFVQLTGSPVLLRMGQDVPLSSGLAPGTLGNYSVQVNLTLDNRNGFFNYLSTGSLASSAANVNITIMAVNSGFFESVRGSSAIRKTILNTNDVEAASTSSSITSSQLVRMIGGASGMHTSSKLTTSLGMPQFKTTGSGDDRVRKMARHHSSMLS